MRVFFTLLGRANISSGYTAFSSSSMFTTPATIPVPRQ
jgi:hypothetical protein